MAQWICQCLRCKATYSTDWIIIAVFATAAASICKATQVFVNLYYVFHMKVTSVERQDPVDEIQYGFSDIPCHILNAKDSPRNVLCSAPASGKDTSIGRYGFNNFTA